MLVLSAIGALRGQTTWDGGGGVDGRWSTAANWNNDTAPANPSGSTLTFTGNSDSPVVFIDTAWTVNRIDFTAVTGTANSFTLWGSSPYGSNLTTLTLNGDGSAIGLSNADDGTQRIATNVTLGASQTWQTTSTGGLTIGAGNLNLGGTTLTTSAAANTTIAIESFINGTGGINAGGAATGTTQLSGYNTFSGGVALTTGRLNINSGTALGTGTLTINSGTIDNTSSGAVTNANNNAQTWAGDFAFTGTQNLHLGNGAVTLTGGTRTVTVNGGTLTVGGVIDDGASTFGVTKAGVGALTLAGANTFGGGTTGVTLNAGTLNINNASALGAGRLNIAGGTIDNTSGNAITTTNAQIWNGNFAYTGTGNLAQTTGAITLGATITATVNGGTLAVGGVIDDGGSTFGLVKAGSGALTLSGANTFGSGATGVTLNAGTLNINNASALGAGTFTITGGTIDNTSGSAITVGNAQNLNADFAFTGTNNLKFSGGTTLGASRAVIVNGGTLELGGAISGTGFSLSKSGVGALTLSGGSGGWNGGVTLNAGTLNINNNAALGSGTFTIANNGNAKTIDNTSGAAVTIANATSWASDFTFAGSNKLTLSNTVTLSGASPRTVTVNDGLLVISGAVSGAGISLGKSGAGALTLSGGNGAWNGGVRLNAGTLNINNAAALGTGTFNIAGSSNIDNTSGAAITLSTVTPVTVNADFAFGGTNNLSLGTNTVNLGAATRTITVNAGTLTAGGIVSNGGIIKAGAGALTLTGNNTFTSGVTLSAGTLNIGSVSGNATTSAIGTGRLTLGGGTIDNTSGGAFTLGTNNAQTWNGDFAFAGTNTLNLGTGTVDLGGGTRTVTTNASTLTVGGVVSNGGITKAGSGSLVLSNAETYTGLTTVNAGTLTLNGANTSMSGGVTVNAGTLIMGNAAALGTGMLTLNSGTIDVTGALVNSQNNAQTWGGDFTFGGTNTLNLGTGTVDLSGGTRTVTVNASTLTVGGSISNGSLTKAGTGTLTLNGSTVSGYTGGTKINAGTLNLDFANRGATGTNLLNSGSALTLNGGTLQLTGKSASTDSQVFNGTTISGGASTVTLTQNSATKLTLDLGTISRSAGATLNFNVVPLTSGVIVNTTTGNTSGIIGPWMSVGTGTSLAYATNNGASPNQQIVAYTYTAGQGVGTNMGNVTNSSSGTNFTAGNSAETLAAAKSANTIQYTGSGKTWNVAGNTLTTNGIMNSGGGALTISDGSANGTSGLIIGANNELDIISNTQTTTVSAVIRNGAAAGSLVYSGIGGGTLSLSGNNTFSGGVVLNSGTLNLASVSNNATTSGIGTGTLTINGGTIDTSVTNFVLGTNNAQNWNGDFTFAGSKNLNLGTGAVTLGGNRVVTISAGTLTVGGVIDDGANTYGLTKSGTGTLALSGANTFSGATTLTAGTLTLGNANALQNSTLTMSGGTLSFGVLTSATLGGLAGSGALANGLTSGLTIGNNNANATYSGVLSGAGALTKTGSGTQTLSGANTYTGKTIIGNGTLAVSTIANVSGGATNLGAPTTVANGTIDLGAGTNTGTLQYTGGGASTNRVVNLAGSTGGGTIDASGSGPLKFTSALTAASGSKILQLSGTSTANNEFAGNIVDSSGIVAVKKSGAGTWILSGTNSYTGTTGFFGGTLILNSSTALGNSSGALFMLAGAAKSIDNTSGSTLTLANAQNWGDDLTVLGTNDLKFSGLATLVSAGHTVTVNAGTFELGGGIAGSGFALAKSGAGALTLSGASAGWNGGVSLNQGTLNINHASALGTGTFTISGGTTIDNTSGGAIALSTTTPQAWNGDFTFTGTNALDLGSGTATVGATRTITVNNSTLTVGTVTGVGGITKTGAGTLAFSGANDYSGGTTLSSGNLTVKSGATLADSTGTVTINGGTLNLNNASQTIGALSGSGGTLNLDPTNLTVDQSTNTTFSGALAGTGSFTKSGSGTLTLAGTSTNTGAVTVNQGTLKLTNPGALAGTAGTTVNSSATLELNAGSVNNGTLTLAGTSTLLASGALTNRWAGDVSLSGDATVTNNSSSALHLGLDGSTWPRSNSPTPLGPPNDSYDHSTISLGANTLTTGGTGIVYLDGRVTGAGNLTVAMSGSGSTSLAANMNTFTGTTTVKNGVLNLEPNTNSAPIDPAVPNYFAVAGPLVIGDGIGSAETATVAVDPYFSGLVKESINFASTINVKSDGLLTINTAQTVGAMTFDGGITRISSGGTLFLDQTVTVNGQDGLTSKIAGSLANGTGDLNLTRQQGPYTVANANRTFTVNGTDTNYDNNTSDLEISAFIKNGGIVKNGTGLMTITSDNTGFYELTTVVNNGILDIRNGGALGASGGDSNSTTVNSGGTLRMQGGITVATEKLTLNGTGYTGHDSVNQGALQNFAQDNKWSGTVVLGTGGAGTAEIQTATSTTLTIDGAIAGSGNMSKTGTGTLVLSGGSDNTYSGTTTVSQGVLSLQKNQGLGSISAGTTVSSGAALYLDNTAIGGGSNTLSIAAEALTISGSGVGTTGALHNVSGDNKYGGSVTLAADATITAATGTNMTIQGGITGNHTLDINNGSNAGKITVAPTSGTITGTVGKVHLDAGTLAVGGVASTTTTLNTLEFDSASSTALLIGTGGNVNVTLGANTTTTFAGSLGNISGVGGQLTLTGTNQVGMTAGSTFIFDHQKGFDASNVTLNLNGGTVRFLNMNTALAGGIAPYTPLAAFSSDPSNTSRFNFGTININGDTILDFGNSAGTFLSSATLTFNGNYIVTVKNWISTANSLASSTAWFVTGDSGITSNPTLTTDQVGTGVLGQIVFTDYNGLTTTWVSTDHNGWFDHEIRPTPEPSTYGAIMISSCLGLLGWRRFRRQKAGSKKA